MICATPTSAYCAGCTRLLVVTSNTKYDKKIRPLNSRMNLSDRVTDWYGSATSMNETPSAVASRPEILSLVPSARTPRAMKGTLQSALNPDGATLRFKGRNPPSKPGFRQSPCTGTRVLLPYARTAMRCAPENRNVAVALNCVLG